MPATAPTTPTKQSFSNLTLSVPSNNVQHKSLPTPIPAYSERSFPSEPVYRHPHPRRTILPLLEPLLPHSLPLLRRIQFHSQPPWAAVLATFPPNFNYALSNRSRTPEHFAILFVDRSTHPETEAWILSSAEFGDLEGAHVIGGGDKPPPGTFGLMSPESDLDHTERHSEYGYSLKSDVDKTALTKKESFATLERRQVLSLLAEASELPPPHGADPRLDDYPLLLGNVSGPLLRMLAPDIRAPAPLTPLHIDDLLAMAPGGYRRYNDYGDQARLSVDGVIPDLYGPYLRVQMPPPSRVRPRSILFGSDASLDKSGRVTDELPPELEWSRVRGPDFERVIAQSDVKRTEANLRRLPHVAIRRRLPDDIVDQEGIRRPSRRARDANGEDDKDEDEDEDEENITDDLAAWGFLSADGSFATMHVEEGWHGLGLMEKVGVRLRRLLERGDVFVGVGRDPDGTMRQSSVRGELLVGYVGLENKSSLRVVKSLGASDGCIVYWCWIDLHKVCSLVEPVHD